MDAEALTIATEVRGGAERLGDDQRLAVEEADLLPRGIMESRIRNASNPESASREPNRSTGASISSATPVIQSAT